MWLPDAESSFNTEHVMAYEWMPDTDLGARELGTLERGYLRDLQDIAAARASCPSLRHVTDRDEQEIRRMLARIELLRSDLTRRAMDEQCREAAVA